MEVYRVNKKIKTEAVDFLFDAILHLKDRSECYSFFEDLCTVNELLSLSQRYEVATMLSAKKTYLEIAEKTGASVEYTFRCVGFMAAPEGANVFRRLGFYTSEEGRLQAEKELEEELANNK